MKKPKQNPESNIPTPKKGRRVAGALLASGLLVGCVPGTSQEAPNDDGFTYPATDESIPSEQQRDDIYDKELGINIFRATNDFLYIGDIDELVTSIDSIDDSELREIASKALTDKVVIDALSSCTYNNFYDDARYEEKMATYFDFIRKSSLPKDTASMILDVCRESRATQELATNARQLYSNFDQDEFVAVLERITSQETKTELLDTYNQSIIGVLAYRYNPPYTSTDEILDQAHTFNLAQDDIAALKQAMNVRNVDSLLTEYYFDESRQAELDSAISQLSPEMKEFASRRQTAISLKHTGETSSDLLDSSSAWDTMVSNYPGLDREAPVTAHEEAVQQRVSDITSMFQAELDTILPKLAEHYNKEPVPQAIASLELTRSYDPMTEILVDGARASKIMLFKNDPETGISGEREVLQIARVEVVDGVPVLLDEYPLPVALRDILESALAENSDLLQAAYGHSGLNLIRFVLNDGDYSLPYTNEVVIDLQEGETYHDVVTTLRHELIHEITHETLSTSPISQELYDQVSLTCTALKESLLEVGIRYRADQLIEHIDATIDTYRPDAQAVLKVLQNNMSTDEGLREMFTRTVPYESYTSLTSITNCNDISLATEISGILDDLFPDEESRAAALLEVNDFYVSIIDDETSYTVMETWQKLGRTFSIEALFNDKHFVQTSSPDQHHYGHAEENLSEKVASIATFLLTDHELLATTILDMPEDDRPVALASIRMVIDIITEDNPELLGTLSSLESDVLSRVNAM